MFHTSNREMFHVEHFFEFHSKQHVQRADRSQISMARIALVKPVAIYLDLIALSEGTSNSSVTRDDGYDVIVSGINGASSFSDYSVHPFSRGHAPIVVRTVPNVIRSTASGRYQLIFSTWEYLQFKYRIGTFSPPNQDIAALHLLEDSHVVDDILAGNIDVAIGKSSRIWASFPGNSYGQGGHTLEYLLETYAAMMAAQS